MPDAKPRYKTRPDYMARLHAHYDSDPEHIADLASRKVCPGDLPDNAVTAGQYADHYGLKRPVVVAQINSGRIKNAHKIKGQWYVVVPEKLFKRMTK